MAKDLNKAMLIGRLGQDPELKYTQSGVAVVSFSVATGNKWKDQEGNWQERTEWHNCKAWRGLAETISNYLKKDTTATNFRTLSHKFLHKLHFYSIFALPFCHFYLVHPPLRVTVSLGFCASGLLNENGGKLFY